ncbi:MAG: hypothetical protein KAW09_03010 [Thermoplasmata archaeon]|nr:hypothetical protein [Thermoplasmata archaeon]
MTNEDKMIELLEELVKWTRVTSIPHVKNLLSEILGSPEERIAYQASDGKSSKEVANRAGVSFGTVTRWWKIWMKTGIAESIPAKGGQRAKRIFSLDDFGIDIPQR